MKIKIKNSLLIYPFIICILICSIETANKYSNQNSGQVDLISNETQNETTPNMNLTNVEYPCERQLYDNEKILTDVETRSVCELLKVSPNFLVRIQRYPESLVAGNVLMQSSSEKFFRQNCVNFVSMCDIGFLLDLYTKDLIIIIQPGVKSKKTVSDAYRQRIIQTIRYNIMNYEWGFGLTKAIEFLDYKEKGGVTKLNLLQSKEPRNFIAEILAPILTVIFLSITLMLFFLGKGYLNKSLFNYMDKLMDYWDEIEDSYDKSIDLPSRTCLFCFKSEQAEFEGKKLYRFLYCCHYYHIFCLSKWDLNEKKCCPCSFEPIEGEESGDKDIIRTAKLNIQDIRNLFGLIRDAYRKEEMYDYFTVREKKIEEFNKKYDISIEEMCWIYQNKLREYKQYRIFYKMWRTVKLMCCIIGFYPSSIINSKKGKLIRKLLNVKSTGSTIGGFK